MRACLMIEGQQGVTWRDWCALADLAERTGFEGLFRSDHYFSGTGVSGVGATDAWTVLGALAARTSTLRLGTLVSPVTFRDPAVLARAALTVDLISDGRVEIGMGAGWWEEEHTRFGLPFYDVGHRWEMPEEQVRLRALRDRLYHGLTSRLTETYVNGSLEHRLPGNLNISFAFVEGESLLMALKDVAVSSGSACTSASLEPSYVLRALGVGDELAHTSIRFGIGRFNTEAEIDYVIEIVVASVQRLRTLSPLWEMHQDGIDLSTIQWTPH